jgi:hypothetical protein
MDFRGSRVAVIRENSIQRKRAHSRDAGRKLQWAAIQNGWRKKHAEEVTAEQISGE